MNESPTRVLTEREVADRLGLSVATLRAWRLRRKGPRYVRFGRAVRYRVEDIDRFVEASVVDSAVERTRDAAEARK
jgi:excisionase family DNA binding protein